MLLAIDIGNSNITAGIFKGRKLAFVFDLPLSSYSKEKFQKKLKIKQKPDIILICSVVPEVELKLKQDLKTLTGKTPLIIGKDLILPIENLYRKKKELGQDRLLNSYAAVKLYKGPAIVIDAGTAITIDAVSKEGAYLGGIIFPGLNLLAKALKDNTALLPKITLKNPAELIGKDTKNSILSGIVFGSSAMCEGIINRIKKETGEDPKIIGTGGNIELIKDSSNLDIIIDKNLTIKGLNLIYEK